MAEGGTPPRESPPKAVVDTSPILNSLEQNKESLKVKLMLRRPLEQLVDQGIMPPLKTPAAFHGQRRQLERAKTGDLLKSKIQQRPSRTELESRHILEPDLAVDPSLADKQRKLKKARLADQLNVQLSHRPGPLELIRKNILHTEEPIEHAVKAGHIPYRATCEGQLNRPQQPLSYVNPEDDSQSSEDNSTSPGPADVVEVASAASTTLAAAVAKSSATTTTAGIVVSLIPTTADTVVVAVPTTTLAAPLKTDNSDIVFADLCRSVAAPLLTQASAASSPASLVSSTSTLSPLSSIASPGPASILSQPATPGPPLQLTAAAVTPRQLIASASTSIVAQPPTVRTDAPGKDKNRKKSKSKAITKARTIKFHEYKGPPSAQKPSASSLAGGAASESSYQLLLEQQQLLLQYQLQLHTKSNKPCLILPAQSPSDASGHNSHSSSQSAVNGVTTALGKPTPATNRFLCRLEDMKVTDLKAELKRRNLPVSGSKPQLIERLKPFTGAANANNQPQSATPSIANTTTSTSCDSFPEADTASVSHNSPLYNSVDTASPQTVVSDEQSEHMEIECEPPSPAMSLTQQVIEAPESLEVISLQQRRIEELERELQLHKQQLEAASKIPCVQLLERIQSLAAQQNVDAEQKLQQQQQQQEQHVAFQNQKNQAASLLLNGSDGTILLNSLSPEKIKLINGHNRSNSLPNFFQSLTTPLSKPMDIKPPPPMYDDSIMIPKYEDVVMLPKSNKKKDVKSQDVDDVLDILIQSGELPASAAQDPLTPNSAAIVKIEQPDFSTITFASSPLHQPHHQQQQHTLQQAHIFQQLLQQQQQQQQQQHQHAVPLSTQQDSAESILGLDANDILQHLDIDDFMELCGQHISVNNNCPAIAASADNANADVSMETDDWLDLLQGPQHHQPHHQQHAAADNGAYAGSNGLSSTGSTCSMANNNNMADITSSQELGYDPVIAIGQNPHDPFNLDEFRSPSDWDRLDFAV